MNLAKLDHRHFISPNNNTDSISQYVPILQINCDPLHIHITRVQETAPLYTLSIYLHFMHNQALVRGRKRKTGPNVMLIDSLFSGFPIGIKNLSVTRNHFSNKGRLRACDNDYTWPDARSPQHCLIFPNILFQTLASIF